MKSRILKILEFLVERKGESSFKEISEYLKVNERTVRYDIEKLNEILKSKNIETIENIGKGKLKIQTYEKILFFLEKESLEEISGEIREIVILSKILFLGEINIANLMEDFDLSRSSVKLILKNLKVILEAYNLYLELNPRKGLILTGNEESIRRLQLKILNEYSHGPVNKTLGKEYIYGYIKEYHKNIDGDVIDKYIKIILKNLDKIISDEAYIILKNYIFIMVDRIFKDYIIKNTKNNENFYNNTREYYYLKENRKILENHFKIKINTHELIKLTDYFLGSNSYSLTNDFYKNWIEIEILVKEIIKNFGEYTSPVIENDEHLIDGLVNHIKPAIYRIKNRIEFPNSIYEEFYESYENIYIFTKKSLKPMEKYLNMEISNDEIAYIGLHFKGALDRINFNKKEVKNILIICGSGYGTSKLLAQQIKEYYNVNILGTIPYNQFENYKNKNIDLIITTLPEGNLKTSIPVVTIGVILNHKTIGILDKYNLPKYNKKISLTELLEVIEKSTEIKNKKNLLKDIEELFGNTLLKDFENKVYNLSDFLDKEGIYLNLEGMSWEESVRTAGEILLKRGSIKKEYISEMINKINIFGPYMVTDDKLALPHSKNDNTVKKTDMVLLTFKENIIFPENTPVKTILAFSSVDGIEHLNALSQFMDLINNYRFLEKIKSGLDSKKIIDLIKKFEFLTKLGKES